MPGKPPGGGAQLFEAGAGRTGAGAGAADGDDGGDNCGSEGLMDARGEGDGEGEGEGDIWSDGVGVRETEAGPGREGWPGRASAAAPAANSRATTGAANRSGRGRLRIHVNGCIWDKRKRET